MTFHPQSQSSIPSRNSFSYVKLPNLSFQSCSKPGKSPIWYLKRIQTLMLVIEMHSSNSLPRMPVSRSLFDPVAISGIVTNWLKRIMESRQ